jgi:putative Mn2+ efflux pump MntP
MKNFLKDMLDQAWTLVGLAIGWLVLEGSAKDVVGKLILITLGVWVITYPIRRDREK